MKTYIHRDFARGFTLIELLVVIAIIGVLSAVILASLNAARSKGNNAGVQGSFESLRNQASIYYTQNNNYGTASASNNCSLANTFFASDAQAAKIIGVIQTDAGHAPVCNNNTAADAWAVGVQLFTPIGSNAYLCTDSQGLLKSEPSALGAGVTACP